jgi:hypothetical protein
MLAISAFAMLVTRDKAVANATKQTDFIAFPVQVTPHLLFRNSTDGGRNATEDITGTENTTSVRAVHVTTRPAFAPGRPSIWPQTKIPRGDAGV